DQRRLQVVPDGLAVRERDTEIAAGELLQVDPVLSELGLVEAELTLDRKSRLRRRMGDAGEVRDRAARREAKEGEVDRDGDEDRQQREGDALDDVVGAAHCLRPTACAPSSG